MSAIWWELRRRNATLAWLGLAHLLLLLLLLVLVMVDERQITGVNLWLKPAKFALSIGVYLWTMAWLLGELKRPMWLIHFAVAAIAIAMLTEQALITLQAFRETTSHYNAATPFDALVFSLMGIGVGVNSAAVALLLLLFLVQDAGHRAGYGWGIRLGLALFLIGSLQGFAMIAQGGHTVGAADGGPGIPVLAWSAQWGDLRVAHFIGIHAIQVLPLLGFWLDRNLASGGWRVGLVWLAALLYATLIGAAHGWALAGRTLFGWWSMGA